MRHVLPGLLCLVLTTAWARDVHAQDTGLIVSGGYSFFRQAGTDVTAATDYPRGWFVAASHPLGLSRLSIAGELGESARDNFDIEVQRLRVYLGGVHIGLLEVGRLQLAGTALAGIERFSEPGFAENGFVFQPGILLNSPLTGRLGLRAGTDYRLTKVEGATFNGFRITAGVSWRLSGS